MGYSFGPGKLSWVASSSVTAFRPSSSTLSRPPSRRTGWWFRRRVRDAHAEEACEIRSSSQARNCANYNHDGYCAMNGRFCSPDRPLRHPRGRHRLRPLLYNTCFPWTANCTKRHARTRTGTRRRTYPRAPQRRRKPEEARGSNAIPSRKTSNTIRDAITALCANA